MSFKERIMQFLLSSVPLFIVFFFSNAASRWFEFFEVKAIGVPAHHSC